MIKFIDGLVKDIEDDPWLVVSLGIGIALGAFLGFNYWIGLLLLVFLWVK